MTPDLLRQLVEIRQKHQPIALVSHLTSGKQYLVSPDDVAENAEFQEAFRRDRSGIIGEQFVAIHNPPLRLVIIGAVFIAQGLIPFAQACGYEVTVIDPRGAFASKVRFPNVMLHVDWPQDVLPSLKMDSRTAFVALTHDSKIDDPALQIALKSPVFYIGALGSHKTQAARQERLGATGFDELAMARINGPIGLAIGGVGAAEIGISIMAEMTKALRLGLA